MKKALTIGELLITMAIIGVIATLVLPGFIQDYHKKIYVTKLKKVTEMIESAISQACTDNNVSYFYQTEYYSEDKAKQQEFIDKYFKKSDSSGNPFFTGSYKSIDGTLSTTYDPTSSEAYAKLAGGEALSMDSQVSINNGIFFQVDINGQKGPNIGGRDMFMIWYDPKTNRIKHSTMYCTTSANHPLGYGCYSRLIENNWEMKY